MPVVGDIRCVEAHFGFPYIENKNDIRYQKDLGGGAILDNLIYPLSFVFRILGDEYINYEPILFYDKENKIDERGYIQFKYDESIANISYGFGHSYRNEVIIWGERAILKVNRVFTRPKNCDVPIQLWNNGKYERYKVENKNHFVEMLYSFGNSIKFNKSTSDKTLQRMSFIEGLCGIARRGLDI